MEHNGINPLSSAIIKLFVRICSSNNISVLFVTSVKDQRVPAQNTKNLCAALKNAGLENLYLLELKNSTHSAYLKDDAIDAENYETTVHALYKKCNLSCDLTLAAQGEELLEKSRL